jgi:hypothetical protein
MNIIFYLKADKVICNRSSSLGYNDGMVGQEITASTLRNFAKAIKLFCEMCDVPIAWKKISRGLPK